MVFVVVGAVGLAVVINKVRLRALARDLDNAFDDID